MRDKHLYSYFFREQGRSRGKIVMRHRGSFGSVRSPFLVRRQGLFFTPGKVVGVLNSLLLTGLIGRVLFLTGHVGFVLLPCGVHKGDFLINFDKKGFGFEEFLQPGNGFCLSDIPVGSMIYGLESRPQSGEIFIRSAGSFGICLGFSGDAKYVIVELPSKERRMFLNSCGIKLGRVSNEKHWLMRLKNAGARRLLGRRPHVRGVAMNPIDHPHGGGEGKTSAGRHPVSPWGVLAKGKKTRRTINRFMVLSNHG